jgi:hypothetical protein
MGKFRSRIRKFRFNRPQRIAALLLFWLLLQCGWVVAHQTLTERDYDYARCGREMWEKPSPLYGYFTSCGNIHDGTLGYRMAGLPLTLNLRAEQLLDHLRKPEERIFTGDEAGSSWELRHQLTHMLLLIRLPFIALALLLGGAIWWVTRRLFGDLGGYTATTLYCCSPAVIRAATMPGSELLTAFALFGSLYTAIGVAHALQGPRRKWNKRIYLLTILLGILAASHIAALPLALFGALLMMAWLAEGRRSVILPILLLASVGSILLLFASYAFQPDAFSYVFRSAAAMLWISVNPARLYFTSSANIGITLATAAALVLYFAHRRSRYFGNTSALVIAAILFLLITTGVAGQPWFWAQPFLFTFIAGVFADAYDSPHGRLFRGAVASVLVLQALIGALALGSLT